MNHRKLFERILFGAVILVLLGFGYWQGSLEVNILSFTFLEATSSILGFGAFIVVSGGLMVLSFARREISPDFDGTVDALVPTYRDFDVVERSVGTLSESLYEDLKITVIVEPEDSEGIAEAERLAEEYERCRYLVNDSGKNSKAGSINYAVENSEADAFAVFDADQEIDRDFIGFAAGYLRDHDVVQGRFIPDTSGLVESLSYYEYQLFGQFFRQIMFLLTDFKMAASKSVLFTREAFEEVEGYSTDVVTEDYDFAHKCYLDRLDVRMVHREATVEEPVHSFSDWWIQRKRWMLGNIQVLEKTLRSLNDCWDDYRTWISLAVGIGSIFGSMFLVTLLPKYWLMVENGGAAMAAASTAAIYLAAFPRILDYREGKVDGIGYSWIFIPFTLPLFSLITIKAALEYLISWEGEWYSVEK